MPDTLQPPASAPAPTALTPLVPQIPSQAADLPVTISSTSVTNEKLSPFERYPWLRLILAVLAIFLVLAGTITGGIYAWSAWQRSRPAAIAQDIWTHFLTADHTDLTITWQLDYDRQFRPAGIAQLTGTHHAHLSYPAISLDSTWNIKQKSQTYSLGLQQNIDERGQIYWRTQGWAEHLPDLLPELTKNEDNTDTPTFLTDFLTIFPAISPRLDDTWWLLDVSQFASQWAHSYPTLTRDTTTAAATTYQCVWRQLPTLPRDQLAALFAQHPFFTLQPAAKSPLTPANGHRIYAVNLDSHVLVAWINALLASDATNNLRDCFSPDTGVSWPHQLSYNALDPYLSLFTHLYLDVDLSVRRPTRLVASSDTDSAIFSFDATITSPTDTSVSPPAETTPLFTLLQPYADRLTSPEATRQALIEQNEAYIATTTPASRNADRIVAINTVADSLRACYQPATGTYLADNAQGWTELAPLQSAGPFAAIHNACLSADVSPAMTDYPYFAGTYAAIPGAQAAGFVICAELEKTPGWQYIANSAYLPDDGMYFTNGAWSDYTPCQPDSSRCYYCRNNIR